MSSFRKRDSMGLYDECEPIPLPERFAQIKKKVSGHEGDLVQSWHRLLHALRQEIDEIASRGSECIPTMGFRDRNDLAIVKSFSQDLRRRGIAVIRGVLSPEDARSLDQETHEYLAANPQSTGLPPDEPQLFDLYRSPAQVKARARPDVLEAQKFVMGTMWHSTNPCTPVSTEYPVTYADRLQIRGPPHRSTSSFSSSQNETTLSAQVHVADGSVERWEPEGYGRSGMYDAVFRGLWEDHDPWDYAPRHRATTDLCHRVGACSMFRMFHGWLCLSTDTDLHDENGQQPLPLLSVCPALKLTTAYFLLRPLFAPSSLTTGCSNGWTRSPIHKTASSTAPCPATRRSSPRRCVPTSSCTPQPRRRARAGPGRLAHLAPGRRPRISRQQRPLPIPVAQAVVAGTHALFLTRQRKAFLLGLPGPDFESGRGERDHAGRPGVSEVNESGGEDALRAMGLLPFEDPDAKTDAGREVARIANALLFPHRFDMTCGRLY
ncbi:uncharacterized protein E0L32_010115 [Thyridium curvatum]|uniref:Uncharacterized protein n=1 Tax=Thyridium curvatum TaxID=1093900 RepID=A0A507AFM3_9PEZI|nr:uncharacterized protein E0L32_010115 [Thyridium curvatum]TPX08385.1 hypothetical protein E0L32_010115 [Thyridium curvatum]